MELKARDIGLIIHHLTRGIYSHKRLNDETFDLIELRDRLIPIYRNLVTQEINLLDNQTSFPTVTQNNGEGTAAGRS